LTAFAFGSSSTHGALALAARVVDFRSLPGTKRPDLVSKIGCCFSLGNDAIGTLTFFFGESLSSPHFLSLDRRDRYLIMYRYYTVAEYFSFFVEHDIHCMFWIAVAVSNPKEEFHNRTIFFASKIDRVQIQRNREVWQLCVEVI